MKYRISVIKKILSARWLSTQRLSPCCLFKHWVSNRLRVARYSFAAFCCVFAAYCCVVAGTLALAQANRQTQLSNLSPGTFDRQFEIPVSENLTSASPLIQDALKVYGQLPFQIGERLRFEITYLGVKGGTAEVLVRTPIKWKESWAHRITGEVLSATWYKWLTHIHDSVEGVFDASPELAPLQFYINQQEGSFRQTKFIQFDKAAQKVMQKSYRRDRAPKSEEFPLSIATKDALGALYFFRSHVPTSSQIKQFEFPVFTSEKTWTLRAKQTGEEKKSFGDTTIDTDVWEITSHFGGLMEQKGDIKLWLTKDDRRLPIYAEAHIAFGYIKVQLTEWDPGHYAPGVTKKYDKLRLEP